VGGVFVYTGDRNRSPAAKMTPVTNPKHHSEGRLVLGTAARARLQSQPGNFPWPSSPQHTHCSHTHRALCGVAVTLN